MGLNLEGVLEVAAVGLELVWLQIGRIVRPNVLAKRAPAAGRQGPD